MVLSYLVGLPEKTQHLLVRETLGVTSVNEHRSRQLHAVNGTAFDKVHAKVAPISQTHS